MFQHANSPVEDVIIFAHVEISRIKDLNDRLSESETTDEDRLISESYELFEKFYTSVESNLERGA